MDEAQLKAEIENMRRQHAEAVTQRDNAIVTMLQAEGAISALEWALSKLKKEAE